MTDSDLIERRLLNSRRDASRYRNRLQIEHPLSVIGMRFSLFIADEIFYDWSFSRWVRNRLSTGASKRFN